MNRNSGAAAAAAPLRPLVKILLEGDEGLGVGEATRPSKEGERIRRNAGKASKIRQTPP